jgi:thiamine biosynthesis lipoprotein
MVLNGHQVFDRIRATLREEAVPAGRRVSFHALGSPCQITTHAPSIAAGNYYLSEALSWLGDFEAKYSRFLSSSLTSRINAAAGGDWVVVDEETDQLLNLCHQMWFLSQGAFDPTALPLIRLWDWKADRPMVPDAAALRRSREQVGWSRVERRPGAVRLPVAGMCLDFGGIGKEYAVDRLIQLAEHLGISAGLINLGADLRAFGAPLDRSAWHVGLEDPLNPGQCWAGVAIQDRAVATSGDYRRKFEVDGHRYGHIIDPRTAMPVANGCRGVSVLAGSCSLAGILATTAFILGPHQGLHLLESQWGVEGALITETQRFETRGLHEYIVRQTH